MSRQYTTSLIILCKAQDGILRCQSSSDRISQYSQSLSLFRNELSSIRQVGLFFRWKGFLEATRRAFSSSAPIFRYSELNPRCTYTSLDSTAISHQRIIRQRREDFLATAMRHALHAIYSAGNLAEIYMNPAKSGSYGYHNRFRAPSFHNFNPRSSILHSLPSKLLYVPLTIVSLVDPSYIRQLSYPIVYGQNGIQHVEFIVLN